MPVYTPISTDMVSKRPAPVKKPDLLSVEGDPTKTIEQQRRDEALGRRGIFGKMAGIQALGQFDAALNKGLTAPPGPADDPAMLAAAAREMQLRRMNRGRGGTVLTGNGSIKLG